jgi:hypothetical protein
MALVKYNNNSISAVTAAASIPSGALVPIKTLTASSSANLSFVHGTDGVVLDNTYKKYLFTFNNMHPVNDGTSFQFQASTNGGTSYGINKVSTFFEAQHNEGDSSTALQYNTTFDRGANSTDFITLFSEIGNDADQSGSGTLHFFNPSDTTFVKHYIANTSSISNADFSRNQFIGGYFNTTSAINALKFEMRTGNIDTGKIKLYGIKDS